MPALTDLHTHSRASTGQVAGGWLGLSQTRLEEGQQEQEMMAGRYLHLSLLSHNTLSVTADWVSGAHLTSDIWPGWTSQMIWRREADQTWPELN